MLHTPGEREDAGNEHESLACYRGTGQVIRRSTRNLNGKDGKILYIDKDVGRPS
ncbi:MAG TPA: hypothetical protein VMV69_20260 [Pirellulales bacterium]|nr:hypothetical protein [Pirellulales bacterium]